ncbi:hypothetical protein MVEN_00155400 [Mycena venus]|uniref:Uncharacterized protein n=1 Tax=Mycena venus TaxID=2733690 RepID=A0A8H6YZT2_9AGAR|nr:hypothetical protein MVEN_00155400 [Mycena venus]
MSQTRPETVDKLTADKWHDLMAGKKPKLDPIVTRSMSATDIDKKLETGTQEFALADVTNRLLRNIYPKDNDTAHNMVPPATGNIEVDHFLEVQHAVALFYEWCSKNGCSDMDVPIGAYMVLSGWINSPDNLYKISSTANQEKKLIALKDYKTRAEIANYLQLKTEGGKKVGQHIDKFLTEAETSNNIASSILKYIAGEFRKLLP